MALFEPAEAGAYLPTQCAVGPWSPAALHGGPVAALLAGEAERVADADPSSAGIAFHPARLSVELLRPVPCAPLAVAARVIRPGRKVQLVDADVSLVGADTVLATARLLRIRTDDVDMPGIAAGDPPPGPDGLEADTARFSGWDGFHDRGVEHRFQSGHYLESGPSVDWIRLRQPVVPDADPTPLQRVAAAADFGNGISSVATMAMALFVNPDLTIHLHRLPAGEWVCLDAVTWMEGRGVAVAESRLWDEQGPLGRSLQSLLVDRRTLDA